MNKNLIIAGYNKRVLENFERQIKSILGDEIPIYKAIIEEGDIAHGDENNVVLSNSYYAYCKVRDTIGASAISEVIFSKVTLSAEGHRRALKVSEELRERNGHVDGQAVVLKQNDEIAVRLTETLVRLGLRDIKLLPTPIEKMNRVKDRLIITTEEMLNEIPDDCDVANLGLPVLDLESLLDIGTAFDMGRMLEEIDLRGAPAALVPVHEGLFWSLENHNKYISSTDVLLKMISGAVIGVDVEGMINDVNANMEEIFGLKRGDVLGKSGYEIFPYINFQEAIDSRRPVKEYIHNLDGENIIVSVEPKTNAGKHYGAVAVVKKFKEEEIRHNRLKESMVRRGYVASYTFDDIVGTGEVISETRKVAKRLAKSNSSVLITGENGTGKEMFAQAIHNGSGRGGKQFVAINCGAIPANLLESELFGYADGAFTGARKGGKSGIFEQAHGGTLFLDEISEMGLALQKKLLRVLQERELVRLGGDFVQKVDIRIIASTNQDLLDLVRRGKFREDLYYRLRVLPLKVPALRERRDDIMDLIEYFADKFGGELCFADEAKMLLKKHQWRGNVRELENCVEYLLNLDADLIEIKHLQEVVDISSVGVEFEPQGRMRSDLSDENLLLNLLKTGLETNRRLGRRSLAQQARDRGRFLGEQEVRRILRDLESKGFVEIKQGKSGTVITGSGLAQLNKG